MIDSSFDKTLAEALWVAHSLFDRGKTSGSSANMSFLCGGKLYITSSGACFGTLTGDDFSELSMDGELLRGRKPSKELPLHMSYYGKSREIRAVIHTHGPYAELWSCRAGERDGSAIPRYTPYLEMKVGKIALVPYGEPGSQELFDAFARTLDKGDAFLLRDHGGIVGGKSVMEAFFGIEELEDSARIACMIEGVTGCDRIG